MFQRATAYNTRTIPGAVATAGVNVRVDFLRKTYLHVAGAIALLVVLDYLWLGPMFESVGYPILKAAGGSRYSWLIALGLFMGASWLAQKWAHNGTSTGKQYAGLILYTVATSFIFLPILAVAHFYFPNANLIPKAGIITLFITAGLTATVFITKKDFSFLRGALTMASFAAMGVIVASIIFDWQLGNWFSGAMILLFCGYILFQTSQIMRHYPPTYHVGAALALFSSISMLFIYVLRLLIILQGGRD